MPHAHEQLGSRPWLPPWLAVGGRRMAGAGTMRRPDGSGTTASPPPAYASIDFATGTEVGGSVRVVTGTGLSGVSSVTVGGVAATSVSSNENTCTFTTPKAAGVTFVGRATTALSSTAADNTCDITITTAYGSVTAAGAYTYTSEGIANGATSEMRLNNPRNTIAGGNALATLACYAGNTSPTQATGSKQPAYDATGHRGGPVGTSDGTDDCLTAVLTSIASGKRPSVIAVFQRVSGVANKFVYDLSDNPTFSWYNETYFGAANYQSDRADSSGASTIDTGTAVDTATHVTETHFDASGALTIVLDGVATSSARTGTTVNSNATKLSLFSYTTGGFGALQLVYLAAAADGFSGAQLTAMRAFVNGAYFPGYTGSSLV